MARGDDNILFDPSKLMARTARSALSRGVRLPSRGKKIFLTRGETLVLTEEDNLVALDFSKESFKESEKISHTEEASVFGDTLVAFHENRVGYEQMSHPSIGVHSRGLRWKLGIPFLKKERGVKGLGLQALDGQALLYDPREEKVYSCQFPKESEMAYTESLLNPSLWQERTVNVKRFIPGEGGVMLFFEDEVDPLYIDASGRDYTANFFTAEDLLRSHDFLHAPTEEAGKIYFTDGRELKTLDFLRGLERSFFTLPGMGKSSQSTTTRPSSAGSWPRAHPSRSASLSTSNRPKKMVSSDGRLAVLLSDRILVFSGEELLAEEKISGVEDIAWKGFSLLLLGQDKIQEKSLRDLLSAGL